ncbi:D-alanyl-D-alanine carboxypeptidase [uncultured Brevundimonas sp.]|uniref:D-alanyl-D-alanine carboxypeptidase n=1 Tax=uncultured Brevundimonas sp. TaxID=213418 RepID=UPI000F940ABE|nr:D-alanyl-D-alanine carboxypeptidase [uncultured Brevundimonas sp.]
MNAAFRRRFLAALVLGGVVLTPALGAPPPVAQSSDNSRYASIVVDAASGEVLFSRFADARRYPASITKVMTLYLTFEALESGKIKLTDNLTVSPRAASQPPSKLGLAAGQSISLDDAMRATAVRSANDMAVVLAEHIAGSEAQFTARMTAKARELGMDHTRFTTANGLPDTRQATTARDLSILSRAVMRDYPQYYRYLGLHDWFYNGRDYRNTNGLLATGRGYDGIKTGFTNASGYNLAASSVRDGKRIITIVMGGRSTKSRNEHVAELMDTGFEVQRRRGQGERIQVAQAFFEQRGYGISADPNPPVEYASVSDEDGEGMGSTAVAYVAGPPPASLPTEVTPPPSARAAAATPRATAPIQRAEAPRTPENLTASLNGGSSATTRRASSTATPTRNATREAARAPAGRWTVQVGAFRDETVARNWLNEVSRRFRTQFTEAQRDVQNADGWYRSRFTGMTQASAEAACEALGERRVTCMVIRPS